MQSFLARLTGTTSARVIIKPDCDYVFLSGYGKEARGQYLRGKLILVLPRNKTIKEVQLRLTGRILLGDHKAETDGSAKWETGESVLYQWDSFLIQSHCAQASSFGDVTYEWPFELLICGNQEESAEGCARCGVTYRLEACTVDEDSSTGVRSFAPIRILRCPPESSYELMDPLTTQGKWANVIEYNVTLEHKAIALGGLIPIRAQLMKIKPEVDVVKAGFYLRQKHSISRKEGLKFDGQRIVTEWPLLLDDTNQQVQTWQQCLHLSPIARRCSPDFDVCGISISHTLHFTATLRDKDGTKSEYEISMPITLFISPELPVNGWGNFVRYPKSCATESDILSAGIQIPPKYCKHGSVSDYEGTPGTPPPAYSQY